MKPNKKIRKDIYQIFIPTLISYLSFMLITLIDGLFVGNFFGTDGISAVGLVQPFILMMTSIIFAFSIGTNTFVGILYGKKDIESANKIFNMVLLYGIIFIGILSIIIIIFAKDILLHFTSNSNVLNLSLTYLYVIIPSQILGFVAIVFSSSRRILHDNKLLVRFSILALVIDILFNSFFVLIINIGIIGIAFASTLSYAAQAVYGVYYFKKKNDDVFKFRLVDFRLKIFIELFFNGFSDSLFDIASALSQSLNNFLIVLLIGAIGLAYNYILYSMLMIIFIIFFALGDSINPLIAKAYGKMDFNYVLQVRNNALKIAFISGILIYIILNIIKPYIFISFGIHDHQSLNYLIKYSYILFLVAIVFGMNQVFVSYMTAIGKSFFAILYGTLRNVIILISMTLLLTYLFGMNGFWSAYAISEFISFLVGIVIIKYCIKLNEKHLSI